MDRENFYISLKEAHERDLFHRLELKGANHKETKTYLASIGHPQGGVCILETYRILEEDNQGYLLKEISEKERKRLERKYGRSEGKEFSLSARCNLRE